MMTGLRRQLLVALAAVGVWAGCLGAALGEDPPADDAVDIKSSALSVDADGQTARFSGEVVLRRGDWVLECSALDAVVDDTGAVSEATAEGPVVLSGPEVWVEAERATWSQKDDAVVLSGKSTVRRGASVLTAEAVTVHLADGRIEMTGVRGRFTVPADAIPGGSDGAE